MRVIRHQAEVIQVGCNSSSTRTTRRRSKPTNSVLTSALGRRFTTAFATLHCSQSRNSRNTSTSLAKRDRISLASLKLEVGRRWSGGLWKFNEIKSKTVGAYA